MHSHDTYSAQDTMSIDHQAPELQLETASNDINPEVNPNLNPELDPELDPNLDPDSRQCIGLRAGPQSCGDHWLIRRQYVAKWFGIISGDGSTSFACTS